MTDLSIAQALFVGETLRARCSKFAEEWNAPAVDLCKGFGTPTPDALCPEAIFAKPFGNDRVAVVQVAGAPAFTTLRFRFLVLGRELYYHVHDPFAIAERFPPNWDARGSLPDLEWPSAPLPKRTVEQLKGILKNGDSPFLLGASQALVDSGKIALKRPEPEPIRIRHLWALLPDSTHRNTWPATFAFGNNLGFDVIVMPNLPEGGLPGYLGEEQVRDYPDSRYERHLQVAIEAGDQRMLDGLLSRRSSAETLRLAGTILLLAVGILGIMKALTLLKVI